MGFGTGLMHMHLPMLCVRGVFEASRFSSGLFGNVSAEY